MKMFPIYNNVLRVLGHIQKGTYIEGHDNIRVMQDVNPVPYSEPVHIEDMTSEYVIIPKRQMRFRDPWNDIQQYYLVIDHKPPDWFWKNEGCVEFSPDHLRRVCW